MKIHNLRTGFATNSSSSHTVVLLPPEMVGSVSPIGSSWGGNYGWDYFRLTETEDKMRYIAAQLFYSIQDKDTRLAIAAQMGDFPDLVAEIEAESDVEYSELSVDHQSIWGMNNSPEVIARTIEFFKSPRVVILGGNDNSDSDSNAVEGSTNISKVVEGVTGSTSDSRLRYDGTYWTVYDRKSGDKMRFSLDDKAAPYTKAEMPELVDLKITNYCPTGCEFCYQSSTIKGKHATFADIRKHVDVLRDAGVFEIAIGGGEPTDHPEFEGILRHIVDSGMTANFTTLSDRWLDNDTLTDFVTKKVGGIGVSCSSAADLWLVERVMDATTPANRWDRRPTVTAQHVIGSVPLHETGEFLRAAFAKKIPVLLLGYKEVGFGKKFERHDIGAETALFLKMSLVDQATVAVSADTALVDAHPDLMAALGVPEALVTSPEGKFSCYIDAVLNKMGPSSYVEPKTMTPAVWNVEDFKAVFATY